MFQFNIRQYFTKIKKWSQSEKNRSQILNIFHPPITLPCRHHSGCIGVWIFVRLSTFFCTIHTGATGATKVWMLGRCGNRKDTDNLFDYQCLSLCFGVILPRLKWSWAESNRRPNKRLTCFLHAYSVIGCRGDSGRGHPRPTVASKNSPALRGFMPAIPSLRAPPNHMPTVGACGRCLVPTTVAGIKLTYCASVMQQERSYFRQLNLVHRWSRLLMREPACLQIHLLAVKTSQPQE